MRATMAAWLALTVAYLLELETPYSAATTVLLVIHPIQGAAIGKGAWRVLGTLAGMLAAIVLMAAFAQTPWLFLLAYGCWLGACVAVMTLLRHFRASGSVVAGYTIGLATFGALKHPQLTFDHVVGRGATVLIGVVCMALVFALSGRRHVQDKLEGMLRRLAAATAASLAVEHAATHDGIPPGDRARRSLVAELYGMDDLLALGKAESPDLAHRATAVRHAMASLCAALVGGALPWSTHVGPNGPLVELQPILRQAWHDTEQCLARGTSELGYAMQTLQQARERLVAVLGALALDHTAQDAAALTAGDRLVEQMDDYLAALHGMATLQRALPRSAPTVYFHRDTAAALQNGLRAMLTLVLAGAFWFITGWPHGDMMLLLLAPYCSLLATSGNPVAGSVQFVKGSMVGVPMAGLCAFAVLPHIVGLPLLLAVLGLFWLPGIWATSHPKYGLAGLAYLVGFNTLTGATNPMHYNFGLFLNWSVAWIAATLFALLGFRVLLPRDVARDIARLRLHIRDDAIAVVRGRRSNERAWQLRQQHRVVQLVALLKATPDAMDQAIGDAWTSLHLGREVFRLRRWMRQAESARLTRPVVMALRGMAHHADVPARAALHARRAVRQLGDITVERPRLAAERHRAAAVLADIAMLLERRADYVSLPGRKHAS